MIEARHFPLRRYIVTASFTTIAVVAVALAAIASVEIRRDLLTAARDNVVDIIRHLQKDLLEDYVAPRLARGEAIDLSDPRQLAEVDQLVRKVATSFHLINVYLFDHEGNILFSTRPEHIGHKTPGSNELYWQAVRGEIAWAVLERGAPLDIEQQGAQGELLETYVPIRSLAGSNSDASVVSNVIEAYQDIKEVNHAVRLAQLRVAAYTTIGCLSLFLVLWWIVRRADTLLRTQTTELVERNRQLREFSQHLESEVARRTHALVQKEKLASLGTLAAGVAHEVNNPLATIAGCAESLRRRLTESPGANVGEAEFVRYLRLIENESFRVKKITQSLLDFSRQQPAGTRERVDLVALAREIAELLAASGETQDLAFTVEAKDGALFASVDSAAIRQLLYNVSRNAIDAIQERTQVEPEAPRRIEWHIATVGADATLICRDTGIGFAPERASELFEPFFTTKEPGKGTGLGLALSHTIAERHGGGISIESAGLRMGAVVTIRLPMEHAV
ncbi:MAG: sensor histidine kinase [Planctomycetota bacterium]